MGYIGYVAWPASARLAILQAYSIDLHGDPTLDYPAPRCRRCHRPLTAPSPRSMRGRALALLLAWKHLRVFLGSAPVRRGLILGTVYLRHHCGGYPRGLRSHGDPFYVGPWLEDFWRRKGEPPANRGPWLPETARPNRSGPVQGRRRPDAVDHPIGVSKTARAPDAGALVFVYLRCPNQ
jgi:hypothetical protein